eukprot:scaffold11203_cov32-Tisochrysis_lutea.AAC.3
MFALPAIAANMRVVTPCCWRSSRSAPYLSTARTASTLPSEAATISSVRPLASLTLGSPPSARYRSSDADSSALSALHGSEEEDEGADSLCSSSSSSS